MLDDQIQGNSAMNGVSHFFHYFAPFPCDITDSNKIFVTSLKAQRSMLLSTKTRLSNCFLAS